jgi:hypothetical protein
MKRRLCVLAASFGVSVALAGCGVLGSDSADDPPAAAATPVATTAGAQPTPSGSAVSGLGSVKDSGDLPDPCTLLSEDEVKTLTGRAITQVDKDDAQPGDPARYCQWQQDGGQLAVFLARTTEDEFKVKIADASPVDGVGQDAFQLAGHLYVLYGTVQIDVYSRGGDDAQNLTDATEVAKVLIPRI